MTPRYPGFYWRPDDGNRGGDGDLGRLPDVGTLHEAVSPNPTSVFGWVQSTHACHAYNGKNGYGEQYADFDRHVEGVVEGNSHCITLESYDGLRPVQEPSYHEVQTDNPAIYGTSANTGIWDPGQCERAADFIAWCEVVLGSIKAVEIPNSIPGQSGWAPHRWGVAPWRVPGGEVWTRHDGKACPGDLRVKQIPGIIARAQTIAAAVRAGRCTWLPPGEVNIIAALNRTGVSTGGGSSVPTPDPTPAPPAPPEDEVQASDIQAIAAATAKAVVKELLAAPLQLRDAYAASQGKPADRPLQYEDALAVAFNYLSIIVREVLGLDDTVVEGVQEAERKTDLIGRIWARGLVNTKQADGRLLGAGDVVSRTYNALREHPPTTTRAASADEPQAGTADTEG